MYLRSLLVATDFSPYAEYATQRAALLAEQFPQLYSQVLHVLDEPWPWSQDNCLQPAQQALQALIQQYWPGEHPRCQPLLRQGKVLEQVLDESQQHDLLVLGRYGCHHWREYALGSVGERLLRKSRCPVLIVNRQPECAYQRVLVPVDFSRYTDGLVQTAQQLQPPQLQVLHVYSIPFEGRLRYAEVAEEQLRDYRYRVRQEAQDAMQALIERHGLQLYQAEVEYGCITTQILDSVHRNRSDLLVIGKHGRSLLEDLLLGSVTQNVLAEAPCDVLVLPASE